jgi:hypothetical protein
MLVQEILARQIAEKRSARMRGRQALRNSRFPSRRFCVCAWSQLVVVYGLPMRRPDLFPALEQQTDLIATSLPNTQRGVK